MSYSVSSAVRRYMKRFGAKYGGRYSKFKIEWVLRSVPTFSDPTHRKPECCFARGYDVLMYFLFDLSVSKGNTKITNPFSDYYLLRDIRILALLLFEPLSLTAMSFLYPWIPAPDTHKETTYIWILKLRSACLIIWTFDPRQIPYCSRKSTSIGCFTH